jgi:hypothetical protein
VRAKILVLHSLPDVVADCAQPFHLLHYLPDVVILYVGFVDSTS